jgi:hypothetical protein
MHEYSKYRMHLSGVAYRRLFTTGLAALRSPCSHLQVLCLPSVASPFAGASVHRTLAFSRLTRPRTRGSFLCVPKERNRKKGHPGLCAPHGYFPCGVPSLRPRLRRSAQGPFFAPAFPAALESPVRTVRGSPARRGGDSLDPRLLSGSPLALARTRGVLTAPLRACSSPSCLTRLE